MDTKRLQWDLKLAKRQKIKCGNKMISFQNGKRLTP